MRRVERNKSRYHAAPVQHQDHGVFSSACGTFHLAGASDYGKDQPILNEYAVGADDDRLVPDDEFRLQNRTENFGNCLGRWTDY